jgi:hypothetical protein
MNPSLAHDSSNPAVHDRMVVAVVMTLTALCVGFAIDDNLGDYSPVALAWLTFAFGLCVVSITMRGPARFEAVLGRVLTPLLVIVVLVQPMALLRETHIPVASHATPLYRQSMDTIRTGVLMVMALGLALTLNLRALRWPVLLVMLAAFGMIAAVAFNNLAKDPHIDVMMFQQQASATLLHGGNPYDPSVVRFPNIYGPGTPFYGPGVVDDQQRLTYGFPYFPLSLLLVVPGYLLGGDVRYAHVAALMLSAAMMCMARPGRWGALAATIFLLTPRALYVTDLAWTEPMLMLTFSIVMLCACRFPRALPYTLGLYFATKQYTILSLPAVLLLVHGTDYWRNILLMLCKAAAVAAVVTLPFFFWNPRQFFRAVVAWQLIQPFRADALSYLVWWARTYHADAIDRSWVAVPGWRPPLITPILAVAPAIVMALWRCARTPAGFAAAVTLINFTFFAFNKQAFCNYYYFVIATACWTVAATQIPRHTLPVGVGSVPAPAHVAVPVGR